MDDPFLPNSTRFPCCPTLPARGRPIRGFRRSVPPEPAGEGIRRRPRAAIWATWCGCCTRTIRSIA